MFSTQHTRISISPRNYGDVIEAAGKRQTKFLSAGSGFASQHNKEVFFGVGLSTQAISVKVAWPAGSVSEYANVPMNHRIEMEEGGTAFKVTPYAQGGAYRLAIQSALPAAPPPQTFSTWLTAPLFGPDIKLVDRQGNKGQLSDAKGSRFCFLCCV